MLFRSTEVFKGVDKGVVVRTIQADTPAAKSDLRPADVITDRSEERRVGKEC